MKISTTIKILSRIGWTKKAYIKTLEKSIGICALQAIRLVKELSAKGLILVKRDKIDKRKKLLKLTPKGKRFLISLKQEHKQRLIEKLSDEFEKLSSMKAIFR